MIDRNGFWFLILILLATTAAAFWRLSLLPDWTHMPMLSPHGIVTRSGLVLFIMPASLLFMIAVFAVQKWFIAGPEDALKTWYRRTKLMPMGVGVVLVLMQGFIISRSFGHPIIDNPEVVARVMTALVGLLAMMQGNNIPKLPRLFGRWRPFSFDDWQAARSRRFQGRMIVSLGLTIIIAAVLLPMRAMMPLFLILSFAFYGALAWYRFRLKREPSSLA